MWLSWAVGRWSSSALGCARGSTCGEARECCGHARCAGHQCQFHTSSPASIYVCAVRDASLVQARLRKLARGSQLAGCASPGAIQGYEWCVVRSEVAVWWGTCNDLTLPQGEAFRHGPDSGSNTLHEPFSVSVKYFVCITIHSHHGIALHPLLI